MTLSIAARIDWIVQQALKERIPVKDAARQLRDFAEVLRSSGQEQSALLVEATARTLTESSE